ncbi:hypothetical protein [Weissella soli]|nr:hypothetical protein [Weissella soli]
MDKKVMAEIANEIFEELKEKNLLENDAIAILRNVIWMISEVQSKHELH